MIKKNIADCFNKVVPTEFQEQKMLNNILKNKGVDLTMKENRTRRSPVRLIAAIVAAVILIVGAAVAIDIFWSEADMARQLLQGNEIVVNGVIIDAPTPHILGDSYDDEEFMDVLGRLGLSMVMVPMEPILEALDMEVSVGLPAEVTEIDGYTFVPLTFFRDELGVLQVSVFEGQVVVENREEFVMM